MENTQDQIQPIDIEFDDILTPQPVREEPAKEEVVTHTILSLIKLI